MRRLYLQIYLTIIAILIIFAVAAGVLWRLGADEGRPDDAFAFAGELATRALPPPDAPRVVQQDALDHLHRRLHADLALYASDGTLITSVGGPPPRPRVNGDEPAWQPGPGGPTWRVRLADGRVLVAKLPRGPLRPGAWLLASFIGIALAVAIGAYPLARRLTRRLERLKTGVERLGQGDLSTRVTVEGKDEVAGLAESFNRSAARIEHLVQAHKMLLANCSHELRTPLTRIAMALTLLGDNVDPVRRAQIKADIGELDQLIEEILLASRLDSGRAPFQHETIDLLALAAEECAREGIAVEGDPAPMRGDRALLRRMIRNLIDNARRHAGDTAPDVRVTRSGNAIQLSVCDHGPGVPEGEREKIFDPFFRLPGAAESGAGFGLGLALVRQIARHHGGRVQCLPASGGGSAFVVTLPAG